MKRIISSIITFAFIFQCAYASEAVRNNYSDTDKHYKISGVADNAFEPLKIEILKSGYTFDDVKNVTAENINDIYLYVDQIYSAEDKSFAFDIPIESEKGNFYAKLSYWNGKSEIMTFCNFNAEDVKNAISDFANDTDKTAAKIDTIIRTYYSALDIDLNDYTKALSAEPQNELCGALEDKITSDTSVDTFKSLANEYMAYLMLKSNSQENVLSKSEIMTKYEKYIGLFGANYYDDWKSFDKTAKEKIAESVSKVLSYDDMKKKIENDIILTVLDGTVWSGLRNKLEYYKDNLSLDLTNADKLDSENQKNLYTDFKAMLENGTINDISQIKGEFDKLAEKYTPRQNPSYDNSPKKGGSSSSSGGGSSFVSPVSPTESAKEPEVPFKDIADIEWAGVPIVKLYQKGIVNGRSDGVFDPNGLVTREEFVAMIVRAFSIKTDKMCDFDDMEADRWSMASVSAAKENGIIGGVGGNMFAPERNITRQDMAVIAYRTGIFAGCEFDENSALSFSDGESIAEYAAAAVSALNKASIVNGSDGKFNPADYTTRAEAAVIIYRLMQSCKLAI